MRKEIIRKEQLRLAAKGREYIKSQSPAGSPKVEQPRTPSRNDKDIPPQPSQQSPQPINPSSDDDDEEEEEEDIEAANKRSLRKLDEAVSIIAPRTGKSTVSRRIRPDGAEIITIRRHPITRKDREAAMIRIAKELARQDLASKELAEDLEVSLCSLLMMVMGGG